MVVVPPWAEAVEGRHGVPDPIAVAQTAAFLDVDGDAEFRAGLLPDRGEAVGVRIARPRRALVENLHLHLAGVAVNRALHRAPPPQREQRGFGLRAGFRCESAELAFRHRPAGGTGQTPAPSN